MNLRTLLLMVICCFTVGMVQGQKTSTTMKKGDLYFNLFKFDKAITQYKKELSKRPSNAVALERIGDSYLLRGKADEAVSWYEKAAGIEGVDSTVLFKYAQSLRANGRYDEAKKYYQLYADKAPKDARAQRLADGIDQIPELMKDSANFRITNLDINTEYAEYSPTYYNGEGIAFPSSRDVSSKKTDNWSGGGFYNLFYSEFDADSGGLQEPKAFDEILNDQYHEGPLAFDTSYTTMYFTRNNYEKRWKKMKVNIMQMKIYKSDLADGKWQKFEELPFTSKDYVVEHPTLSADGKTIYFASDMTDSTGNPEGYGGLDLYKSTWDSAGWSQPENLGAGINTPGHEQFPFLHSDGTLYFASDAYPGFGGIDQYSATNTGGSWGNVTNLGYPLNSNADDFGIIWDENKKTGYFTSNRTGGEAKGDDDIYSFTTQVPLTGLVFDGLSRENLPGSVVHLIEVTPTGDDTVATTTTDSVGFFTFDVDRNKDYKIPAFKTGYSPNKISINTGDYDLGTPVRIPLYQGINIIGTVYLVEENEQGELIKKGTLADVDVILRNSTDGTNRNQPSAEDGSYGFRVPAEKVFIVDGEKLGYFLVSTDTVDTRGITEGVFRTELLMQYIGEGQEFVLKNIYYDFDKYNIRPDAAKELDRLSDFLKKHEMSIEMRSHTDCRGSVAYNIALSTNRANSAANYLIAKDPDTARKITASGYGETSPFYPDLCETDQGVTDRHLDKETIDKHQKNRRTSFFVVEPPKGIRVLEDPDNKNEPKK